MFESSCQHQHALIAQWQSTGFVTRGSSVQVALGAPVRKAWRLSGIFDGPWVRAPVNAVARNASVPPTVLCSRQFSERPPLATRCGGRAGTCRRNQTLPSSIRQGTALVRRKGWIEASRELHLGTGSPIGRRRLA
jgi:hypothetical protein